MSGGEYAPKDSRDVTLHPTIPGKPSGWRESGRDGDAAQDKLSPDDSRNVTGAVPAGSAPGADSGWREAEALDDPAGGTMAVGDTGPRDAAMPAVDPHVAPATNPPPAVPQSDAPFTAEEAAAAGRRKGDGA